MLKENIEMLKGNIVLVEDKGEEEGIINFVLSFIIILKC